MTKLKYPLANVKETINKWLFLEIDEAIDVMMAIYVANRFQTEPLWMIFIGAPSNSKTELLRAFDKHEKVYFLSSVTPATFVSGKVGKKASLLPKIIGKLIILKDFGGILSMRREGRQEVLSQLREIYDGKYDKAWGTGKEEHWTGIVGLLAASTPAYDKYHSVIGALGDRFLLYRIPNNNDDKMGTRAQDIVGREDEMRQEIREAVHTFINQFDSLKNFTLKKDESMYEMVRNLAIFSAYTRCPVDRDWRDRQIYYKPVREGISRLVKQFTQLGMALALVHGKESIDFEIYGILKKVARDLTTTYRLEALSYLWKEKVFEYIKEWRKTGEVAEALNVPPKTARWLLEDLMVVDLLNRKMTEGSGANQYTYEWQLNEVAYDMMAKSEVFEDTSNIPF